MKMFRIAAFAAALFAAAPAFAQWQVPDHAVPVGRGGGVVGFKNAPPGTAGIPLVSNGPTLDPSFTRVLNNGIQPGAANTLKGSLDGTSISDIAVPACTGLGQALRWTAGTGYNCGTVVATTGFDMPINLGMSASSNGTSLTLTVTQASGSAPTTLNPVVVPFRSTTLTNGTVVQGSITGSVSLTIPNGATFGTSNTVPFRLWIFLTANGGGTPALAVATCSNTTTVFPCSGWESILRTTTTIGAGSTSAGVPYAAAGVASDSVRIVGYCDYANGLVTAGSWVSSCTTLQLVGPGIKKPGEVVQIVQGSSTVAATTTSASFAALTNGLSVSISPTTSPNLVRATVVGTSSASASAAAAFVVVRGSTTLGVISGLNVSSGGQLQGLNMVAIDAPGTTSSTAYSYQGRIAGGNTLSLPPASTGVQITLEEIQG